MPVRKSRSSDELEQEQPVFKSVWNSLYSAPSIFMIFLYSGPVLGSVAVPTAHMEGCLNNVLKL